MVPRAKTFYFFNFKITFPILKGYLFCGFKHFLLHNHLLWFLTFSLCFITQTKITVKIIYFEFISLKHYKPSISLGFILQITWKALGWVILNWNRNRFQNVLQRQNFIPVAKWEVAKGEKSPIRYISSIVSKWRIFPVINENVEIGPNLSRALTAKPAQTRWLGFGWNDQV